MQIHFQMKVGPLYREVSRTMKVGVKHFIGRESDWLKVDHPSVSRKHFFLEFDGMFVNISDNSSRRGTFVNGAILKRSPVSVGDRIDFGDCELKITRIGTLEAGSTARAHAAADTISDLQSLSSNLMALPALFERALLNPRAFFDSFKFEAPARFSVGMIACISAFACALQPFVLHRVGVSVLVAACGAMAGCMVAIFFAKACEKLSGVVGMDGDFDSYLAFTACVLWMLIPATIVGLVSPLLGMLTALYFFGWAGFGLARVFRPAPDKLFRAVILLPVVLLLPLAFAVTLVGGTVRTVAEWQAQDDVVRALAKEREREASPSK